MLSTLWTVAVRAIAVLTAGLAVGVIVTSLYAARAEAGPYSPPLEEAPGEAQPLLPVQAAQPAPAQTYQVPTGALPATRASALSVRAPATERREAQPSSTRPLVAVLDVGHGEGAEAVESLALLVKTGLEARGYETYLATKGTEPNSNTEEANQPGGDAEPLRPDAYITIRGAAGAGSQQRAIDAWYCELEGSLSGRLAHLILEQAPADLAGPQEPQDGQGEGRLEDPEAFRCDDLLAGRAHMPAVLLQLSPAALDGPLAREDIARGITAGVDQFFLRYGDSLRQVEEQRRMVWPAVGPVTSFFGPAHPLGIDIGQSQGAIVAATDGTVAFAGGDPCCSYGLYVVIDGPDNITTVYGHFESIIVTTGQRVRQGQPLGLVGCTGHCFGTHLHFEVIDNGVRRDPLLYLP
jgi:murein DD-endopeptidase MepM/ murein hydrolase activator NlpD